MLFGGGVITMSSGGDVITISSGNASNSPSVRLLVVLKSVCANASEVAKGTRISNDATTAIPINA